MKASLLMLVGSAAMVVGCDQSTGSPTPVGTGGTPSTGGASATGGSAATGGASSTGGKVGTGGATVSGGATGQGGSTSQGGAPATGGKAGTGGAQATGGVAITGGASAAGGTTSATTASGGITPPGGVPATGGTVAPGGVPATGGTTPTGGTTAPTGGTAATGGTLGTGGTTASGSGGVPATGGASAQGGSTRTSVPLTGHYQMENLDRGVVAVKVSGGVYVGWRMMGYEYTGTDSDTSYILYKDGTKLATVTDSTNYLDAAGTTSSKYTVSCVLKGVEGPKSNAPAVWAQQYLSVPIQNPGGYEANDATPGDLDGDGQLDIVLKWDKGGKDSASSGTTDPCIIDGYTMAGKRLWSVNVGMNIRAGAHDTQMSVYDFDGDGKAELGIKTAPGTKDGLGNYLKKGPAAGADNTKDYRGARGMALGGPEWFTVFDGATGAELDTIEYPVLYASHSWGDTNGNRSHRYTGGFAFVKDVPAGGGAGVANGLPSAISGRGYYTVLTVSAMSYRNGVLAKNWVYDSVTAIPNGGGDHSCMAADVDGDGGQEIIPGARTIGSDGKFMCDSGMGHGDALHVGELVKGKGISVFSVHESLGGMDCHDAATCSFYFKVTQPGSDTGRGVAEYVSASDLTAATCSSSVGGNVNCGTGGASSGNAGSNFLIYWNADGVRSTMNGTTLPGVSTAGTSSCNGTKSTPTLNADLLGDWREESVLRETSNAALRVYTTTDVTKRRIYTLMHDPTYRAQVNFEQSTYNQPPHVGFHIGAGMANPPVPSIHVK